MCTGTGYFFNIFIHTRLLIWCKNNFLLAGIETGIKLIQGWYYYLKSYKADDTDIRLLLPQLIPDYCRVLASSVNISMNIRLRICIIA